MQSIVHCLSKSIGLVRTFFLLTVQEVTTFCDRFTRFGRNNHINMY